MGNETLTTTFNAMSVSRSPLCYEARMWKQNNGGAPVLALLLVQIAEPPQCGAPPSVCDAWPWQPLAVLLLLVTFQLRSPSGAAAAVTCHVTGTHYIHAAEVECVTARRGLGAEGGG